uniref:autotransporter-associated beta strand repeat-containing protein n=1 Tax=Candidatus Regiella insecticola TaxID=138073 RepID=UPI0005865018
LNADLNVAEGSQDMTLNGVIKGEGKIIKSGSAALQLNQSNHYSGGTVLNKGTVRLSNAKALGSGGLVVTGSATLDTVPHLVLDTPIELKADLDITGRYLTLNSIISGSGGIIKSSSAPLRLNAANRYNGGTTLYDGKLLLGHPMALGQGALMIKGAAILDNQLELALNNRIELQDDLNVMGIENLTLNAVISGTKGLTKYGQAALTLNAANTYQGIPLCMTVLWLSAREPVWPQLTE